jgi:hypothetical protein
MDGRKVSNRLEKREQVLSFMAHSSSESIICPETSLQRFQSSFKCLKFLRPDETGEVAHRQSYDTGQVEGQQDPKGKVARNIARRFGESVANKKKGQEFHKDSTKPFRLLKLRTHVS